MKGSVGGCLRVDTNEITSKPDLVNKR